MTSDIKRILTFLVMLPVFLIGVLIGYIVSSFKIGYIFIEDFIQNNLQGK